MLERDQAAPVSARGQATWRAKLGVVRNNSFQQPLAVSCGDAQLQRGPGAEESAELGVELRNKGCQSWVRFERLLRRPEPIPLGDHGLRWLSIG